jgi:hypothetical protein
MSCARTKQAYKQFQNDLPASEGGFMIQHSIAITDRGLLKVFVQVILKGGMVVGRERLSVAG